MLLQEKYMKIENYECVYVFNIIQYVCACFLWYIYLDKIINKKEFS